MTTVLDETARKLLFTEARTSNTFASTPVSDEELRDIWELTRWTPTAMNSQPLRVVFIRTEEGKNRLVPLMAEGNQAKTQSAPAVAIVAVDRDFHEELPTTFPIFPGARDMLAADDEGRQATAHLNAGLQGGAFLLAIRAAGLAAGPMTGFDKAGIDAEFFAGTSLSTLMVVNIGHPGENPWFDRLPRVDAEKAVTWA